MENQPKWKISVVQAVCAAPQSGRFTAENIDQRVNRTISFGH
jgi:hypothetical protein